MLLDKRYLWVGGLLLAVGGFWYYKRQQSSTANSGANSSVVDPNAPAAFNPGSIPAQGVTDSNGNLLPQFSWPYNQLALPYDYSASNVNGQNYNQPASSDFVGYGSTPVG